MCDEPARENSKSLLASWSIRSRDSVREPVRFLVLKKQLDSTMIHFIMLMSRQGKVRLTKWYTTYSQKERQKVAKEITPLILARPLKLCNFLDWKVSPVG